LRKDDDERPSSADDATRDAAKDADIDAGDSACRACGACMAGTNAASPRCAALRGTAGGLVDCGVYAQRPAPCREVQPGDDKCERARNRHGLAPLHAATLRA